MGEAAIGSRELVEQVWRRVALREELAAEPKVAPAPHFPPLEHDMERHFVNRHCVLDRSPREVPAAGRFKKLKTPIKRRLGGFMVAVLDRYFDDEQEFLAHLVRYQNSVAERHDHLARDVSDLHRQFRAESISLRRHMVLLQETFDEKMAALERARSEAADVSGAR